MSNPIPPVSTLKAHVVVWDETFSKDASVILVGEDGFPVAELPINLSVILFQNDSRDARLSEPVGYVSQDLHLAKVTL